ncbi:MAG: LCP family protein [bacterium]|nr:LCP family protein [bacterium]
MTSRTALRMRRRKMQRRIWIGIAALVLLLMAVAGWRVYGGFKEIADQPFAPDEAGAALEERTPEQVEEGRQEIEAQEMQNADRPEEEATEVAPPPEDREGVAPDPEADGEGVAPDPEADGEVAGDPGEEEVSEPPPVAHARSPVKVPDAKYESVLLMGADASGYLADVILFALFPDDGSAPALVSIPRDLYLYNFCSEDFRRVNANLGGCTGFANGPELLALAIEDFTGIAVDHFAKVDFDGFVELVDGLGGIEICFDYPTYDEKAHLDITEPGCRMADGATALAYARSRNARQLVDGEWQRAWSSDFTRQAHQQELLLTLAGQLRLNSPADLLSTMDGLSHTIRLDKRWSIAQAVDWAVRYRDLDPSSVSRLTIPVADYRAPSGAQVLVPTTSFADVLSNW